MTEGKKTPVWVLRPQQRPVKMSCQLVHFGGELWADPCNGERHLLMDFEAFVDRADAVARTQDLVKKDIEALRRRLMKLERLLLI